MTGVLRSSALVLALVLTGCTGEPEETATEKAVVAETPWNLAIQSDREVYEPQVTRAVDGSILVAWRETGPEGSDLFVARVDDRSLGDGVQVNDEPGTVESFPHDEMRAAVAAGAQDRLALAWADRRGQVRVAESSNGGRTFAPSIRLEQVDAAAYRGFPALAYGASGTLHAIWIDSRHAEGFAEEPADLFYATVEGGLVTETNLTATQEATVCGCCRTHLETTAAGQVRSFFRNADADGYRDIFATIGREGGAPWPPRRIGQPLWKLQGCPMSGPIAVGDHVLWPDGSSGKKLLMVADLSPAHAEPLFTDAQRGDWKPRLSPRRVVGDTGRELVLLPGQPGSRLVERAGSGEWQILADGLPVWATSALHHSNSLVLLGAVDGKALSETHPLG